VDPSAHSTRLSNGEASPSAEIPSLENRSEAIPSLEIEFVNAAETLAEVSVLLEDYAPIWYTEKQHDQVLAALKIPAEILADLRDLLEDYAPIWYSQGLHDRMSAVIRRFGISER
jgi:hypothetical protein